MLEALKMWVIVVRDGGSTADSGVSGRVEMTVPINPAPERAYSPHRQEAREPAGFHGRDAKTRSPRPPRFANGESDQPSPSTHVFLEVPCP